LGITDMYSTKIHNNKKHRYKEDCVVSRLNNFPCIKLGSRIMNTSNGRHWFLLMFSQVWMPHIDNKHESGCCPVVPHLVLKTVIKYEQISFLPRPKTISENAVSI
jgi:hypothetical protein